MSMKDLKKLGILLPEKRWGEYELHTKVSRLGFVVTFSIGIVGGVLAYVGNGTTLTWIGILLYFVFLGLVTWISVRAVDQQNEDMSNFLDEGQ